MGRERESACEVGHERHRQGSARALYNDSDKVRSSWNYRVDTQESCILEVLGGKSINPRFWRYILMCARLCHDPNGEAEAWATWINCAMSFRSCRFHDNTQILRYASKVSSAVIR